jgi:hypothetical protein
MSFEPRPTFEKPSKDQRIQEIFLNHNSELQNVLRDVEMALPDKELFVRLQGSILKAVADLIREQN